MHDRTLMEYGDWYACEQPERPHEPGTWWEVECRACMVSLAAVAALEPNLVVVNETVFAELPASDAYEQHREKHGLPSLTRLAL